MDYVQDLLVLLARGVLALVFALASIQKLRHPTVFLLTIADYDLVPIGMVKPLARVLPICELLVAICLAMGLALLWAAAAAAWLLVVFSFAIGINLARGRTFVCGCYGTQGEAPATWMHLARNATLLLLAAIAATAPTRMMTITP